MIQQNQHELFGEPPRKMGELSEFEEHIFNVRDLNEPQSIYANLLLVSDFEPEEIEEVLEWTPTDEEMQEIREVVSFERSMGDRLPVPSGVPMPPPHIYMP